TIAEPRAADNTVLIVPTEPNPVRNPAVPAPTPSIVSATPRLAPELTPSENGSASGFWNRVCICNPAIASAAPARLAVTARGNRMVPTTTSHRGSWGSMPTSTRNTSGTGTGTDPSVTA